MQQKSAPLCICDMLIAMQRKDPAAVSLGRRGGKNSRKNLTEEEKRELARRAANARWKKAKTAK
jgi:hypothetical protein